MSNTIRTYDPDPDWMDDAKEMDVTAMVGSEEHGHSVQLTIGREYTVLTEKQILDLIGVLSKRLACEDNFSATAPLDEKRVQPDGTKEVIEKSW